jgi:two-component system, NtrC family, sensor histidine kinase HupT/HoxJ
MNLHNWLLLITSIFVFMVGFYLFMRKNKTLQEYFTLATFACLFVWTLENLLVLTILSHVPKTYYVVMTASILLPIFTLFLSFSFYYEKFHFKKQYYWLFVLPAIHLSLVYTDNYNDWFFKGEELGPMFYVHTFYSYILLLVAIVYFMRFINKNTGLVSKQGLWFIIGISVPIAINVMNVFVRMDEGKPDTTPIAFTVTVFLIWYATFKYDLFKALPIAHRIILDHISDGFVMLNSHYEIVETNKTFDTVFVKNLCAGKRYDVFDIFAELELARTKEDPAQEVLYENEEAYINSKSGMLEDILKRKIKASFEVGVEVDENKNHYHVEICPIYNDKMHRGFTILFKDITEHKKKLDIIRENEARLLRAEKFSFLGEVTGGLTHIIKNKISSIGYYAVFFEYIVPRFHDLYLQIENQDGLEHEMEVYEGMQKRILAIKSAVKDIDMMIANVSNQILELGKGEDHLIREVFTLGDFLNRMKSFISLEAKEQACDIELDVEEGLEEDLMFEGVLGILIQAIMNLLSNSLYEYRKNDIEDKVILRVKRTANQKHIEFHVVDFGNGIPQEIRKCLFKKIVTTKGEEGTGIGLYTTYSGVRDKLNGYMEVLDVEKGATFIIGLPVVA